MNLRTFYEHTLPPTGHYTLFIAGTRRHIWADSLDVLVDLTEAQGGPDVYFATATFDEPTNRTQVNVNAKKCFYLDLDAGAKKLEKHGPEKAYETQRHALQGVKAFLAAGGPQPTLIVSSGEGLHIYWELTEPIAGSLWSPVAKAFNKYAARAGLKVDSSVTGDSARVLRPIGRVHPNGKTVQILAATDAVYSLRAFSELVECSAIDTAPTPKYDLSINDDITLVQGPPKSLKKLLSHCGAARYAAANQDSIEEPYWRLMIGLAKHTIEGRDAAHALSCRHPDYDEAETNGKFDRWATGPSTCETFSEYSKACAKCPSKGKIKSPIQLGAMNTVEVEALPEEKKPSPPPPPKESDEPWDGHIPQGFDVAPYKGKRALVHFMDIEKEGEDGQMIPMRVTVPISYEVFWLGHWADAAHADDFAQATVFRLDENKRVSTFTMDQAIVASRAELSKFYAGKGIHTTTDKRALAAMEAYTKASLQLIKARSRRPKIHDRMGLVITPDNQLICAQGKYAILPDGTITETILSPALRSVSENYRIPLPLSATGTWDTSVWRDYIKPAAKKHVAFAQKYYAHPGLEKYQLAFMLGLASPLMAFVDGGYTSGTRLPRNGLSVSMYSKEGGRGKTTLMQVSLLAYGNPQELNSVANDSGSTALGRIGKLSLAGTMPVGMDEMGSTDEEKMAGLVSSIANGASRTGMTKDGGMVNRPPWALITLLAANKSARDMISVAGNESDAIQYRLLEIDMCNMPEFDSELQEQFRLDWAELQPCAGALGALVHLVICRHGAEKMSTMVATKVNEAAKLIRSVQVDRFQFRALGAMLVLQDILEQINMKVFETSSLVQTFRECHSNAVDFIKENTLTTNGFELLSKALHDLLPNTVITLNETRRLRHVQTYDDVINRMPDQVHARHIVNTGITYVAVDALKRWCLTNKVRIGDILVLCKRDGIMTHVYPGDGSIGKDGVQMWASNKNLMAGTRTSTNSRVSCYAFNTKLLSLKVGGGKFALGDMINAAQGETPNVVSLKKTA